MFNWFAENSFMPHGHCYYWRPDILWLHVVSDAIIALAYFSIPVTLLYFLRRRPDIPFPAMIVLFAVFIVLCGSGHILEVVTVWNPIYALQGTEKAATAVASIITAVAMVPIVPQVLAMRTPAELQKEVDKAVEQLRETQDKLVQNEKMASLGALVAGVSHEINTPVGIGVTAASMLEERTRLLGKQAAEGTLRRSELDAFVAVAQESSQIILRNLQRAADLIQSFKQVAVDQASGERRQFALRAYIDEVLLNLGPRLKRTAHTVSVDCPAEVVPDSYPGALAQVLTNLVDNSLLHGFPEGRTGHIAITAREQAGMVRLDYSDDGIGMPPEDLRRIFDPFFTTKRGKGGSGLGMHIVYNLVTQMLGGAIDVTSAPGQGTQVHVSFPMAIPKAAA
jgi:signal transduction histidine kinase